MATLTVSEEQLNKVISDVETLINDVASIVGQDSVARKRFADVKANPSIGKSEAELDEYLKNRGVKLG